MIWAPLGQPSLRPCWGYAKLSRSPSIFRSFTGLELSEFDSVYDEVARAYSSFEERRLSRSDRQREIGAGRARSSSSSRTDFSSSSIYYRMYVTSTLIGFLFDLGQTNVLQGHKDDRACRERGSAVARESLSEGQEDPYCGGALLGVQGSDRLDRAGEIPRPKTDKQKRKTHYSGKRKKHTVKTQLTVNSTGSDSALGPATLAEEPTITPSSSATIQTCPKKWETPSSIWGYFGIAGDYPEMHIR